MFPGEICNSINSGFRSLLSKFTCWVGGGVSVCAYTRISFAYNLSIPREKYTICNSY